MIRYLNILFVTTFIFLKSGKAQDLIVTSLNDSINCKVLRLNDGDINYRYVSGKEIKVGSISTSEIRLIAFNYYPNTHQQQAGNVKRASIYPYKNLRLGFHAGFSYLTAEPGNNTPAFLHDYYNDLRSSWHLSLDAGWYFIKNLGVTMVYDHFQTKGEYENNVIATYPNGVQRVGKISDDIDNYFIGAGLSARVFTNNRAISFMGDIALGRIYYHNNAVAIDSYEITGNTMGTKLNLSIDFRLDENFALTVGASRLFGTLETATFKDAAGVVITRNLSPTEDLSRIDVFGGLRLYLF